MYTEPVKGDQNWNSLLLTKSSSQEASGSILDQLEMLAGGPSNVHIWVTLSLVYMFVKKLHFAWVFLSNGQVLHLKCIQVKQLSGSASCSFCGHVCTVDLDRAMEWGGCQVLAGFRRYDTCLAMCRFSDPFTGKCGRSLHDMLNMPSHSAKIYKHAQDPHPPPHPNLPCSGHSLTCMRMSQQSSHKLSLMN